MKKIVAVIVLLACGTVLARSTQPWTFEYRPFKGEYRIYGGTLGEETAPTKRSKNIAYQVQGPVAKHMFEAMGPDLKDVCGAEDGQRIRQRAEVSCSFHPKDGYHCNFGFDLITGRSIAGIEC
jgi:hypothetical protein